MLGPNLYNCVSHRDVWQDGVRHIRIYDGTKKEHIQIQQNQKEIT
jgi:hypothetical protein